MKIILKLFIFFIISSLFWTTLWASLVEKFDVKLEPQSAKVWEAVDLTIKALDKNWEVVKDYVWNVFIFTQNDGLAEFPWLTDNTYKFKLSDAWVIKFENWVKFKKSWTQEVNVYDLDNEKASWIWEIKIWSWTQKTASWEISIKSPENGITLWSNNVKVSWTTLKNHKVKIFLNWDKNFETISNSEWNYEYSLSWVSNWDNSLVSKLYDSDMKQIWESTKIVFKVESNAPKFKSIKVTPDKEIIWETLLKVEVEATSWLKNVEITLNEIVVKLTESWNWIYKWNISSPKENGTYNIDLTLKNELWIETKEKKVKSITVKNVELASSPKPQETQPVSQTWSSCEDLKKELLVNDIKVVKMKSKSILSWEKVEKATWYNLYKKEKNWSWMTFIQNIVENKVEINIEGDEINYDEFSIKAVLKNETCDIEWVQYSKMTKVQTWPKELILIIVSLITVFAIFYFRKKSV